MTMTTTMTTMMITMTTMKITMTTREREIGGGRGLAIFFCWIKWKCNQLSALGIFTPSRRKLNMQLHAKLESRKKKLQLGLEDAVREKIRMPARDLKITLTHSSKILELFYPHHVTNRQGLSLEEFFER